MWQTSWTKYTQAIFYRFDGKERQCWKSWKQQTAANIHLRLRVLEHPSALRWNLVKKFLLVGFGLGFTHFILSKYQTWILLLVQLSCNHSLLPIVQMCFHPMDGSPHAFHALEVLVECAAYDFEKILQAGVNTTANLWKVVEWESHGIPVPITPVALAILPSLHGSGWVPGQTVIQCWQRGVSDFLKGTTSLVDSSMFGYCMNPWHLPEHISLLGL